MATIARDADDDTRLRYSTIAIALHWAIAALVLYNLSSGLLRPFLPRGFFMFHVSSGITILLLSVVRVAWRLTHRPPPSLPMRPWERTLAHAGHALLYAMILLLPFSGWAMISANPPAGSPGAAVVAHKPVASPAAAPLRRGPTMFWGVVRLPLIAPIHNLGRTVEGVPQQRALHDRLDTAHLLGGWLMLALVVLHVAGALKHQLVDRRRQLARMGLGFA